MSESATNTTNMPQTTPTYSVEPKPVTTPVQPTAATVDMTSTKGTVAEPQVNNNPPKGFDTNNASIPTTYAQRYMSGINKTPTFQKNQNDDEFSLTNSLGNSALLTLAFKNDFKRQAENRTSFEQSQKLIATLDNQKFKYTQAYIQGCWQILRTPIDPNTGEAIGLPEMLPA